MLLARFTSPALSAGLAGRAKRTGRGRQAIEMCAITRWAWLACAMLTLAACQSSAAADNTLLLSGVIEAIQVDVVAEVGGRVIDVAVDEGDAVQAGEPLVRLDSAAWDVQVRQAEAALSVAQANLAQLKAGARQEAIAAAAAVVKQSAAEHDGAQLALANAQRMRDDPQELLSQIDAARTAAKQAAQGVVAAHSRRDEARRLRDLHAEDDSRREAFDKRLDMAGRELAAAQAQSDGATAQLQALEAVRRAPVALQAQVNGAHSAYSMTLASLRVAEAGLAELKAGPAPEDVALAEAQVRQAQARLKMAQAYASRATLYAPLTGVVSSRSVHAGEIVQPGLALMTLANLDEVTLVVYVPQPQLPRVQLGGQVRVRVDAYAGDAFSGEVTSIARQAQFTSRDTQAAEDRANVVFAVKVRLPNPGHRLRPGMTADAVIELIR